MIKIVMNRHSAKVEKVEFINDDFFDGKFPAPNVDRNITLKRCIKIAVLIIIAELWCVFSSGYDSFLLLLFGATIFICGLLSWLIYIECNPCKHDIRCNNEEFVSSDVIWFYAKLHCTYAYIGLTMMN